MKKSRITFRLSEQTIKNHLYRVKHKIGAEDRLRIVHLCRVQGFMSAAVRCFFDP